MEVSPLKPQDYVARDRFARLCGIEVVKVSSGYARVQMKIGAEHLNGHGSVHGGVLFTLADYAFAAACNSHEHVSVGINMNISCVKAVSEGTLIAEGREVSDPRRLSSCIVEIRNEKKELVALFQGLAYNKVEK
jgi:acyl-CoA thioesterase